MITYDTLSELAHALSKVTGYHYVAFHKSYKGDLLIYLSDSRMFWRPSELNPPGWWLNDSDSQVLEVRDLPELDWSKFQFYCKEADNEEES